MLSPQEQVKLYESYSDDKIIQLVQQESKHLRADVIPILEQEILKRNLNKNLIEWIKLDRHFFEGEELEALKTIIRNFQCTACNQANNPIQGFNIRYLSILDAYFEADLIICRKCGQKHRRKSYLKTATSGFISFKGILMVPLFFFNELLSSFTRKKNSNKIIENFIFEHTGLIRKHGIEYIHKLLQQHNKRQLAKENKYID